MRELRNVDRVAGKRQPLRAVLIGASGAPQAFTVLAMAAFACFAPAASLAEEASVAIGKICFEHVQRTDLGQFEKAGNGTWKTFSYALAPEQAESAAPRFVLFRRPLRQSKLKRSCGEIVAAEVGRHNPPLLDGTITSLSMTASEFTAEGAATNRFQIDSGALKLTLAAVRSTPLPAHGGTVDLRPHELTLSAPGHIFTDVSSATGAMEIATTGAGIARARIALHGGATVVANLAPPARDAAEAFLLDLGDGSLKLLEAELVGVGVTHLRGAALENATAVLQGPDLVTAELSASVTRTAAEVSIGLRQGTATRLTAGGSGLSYELDSPRISGGRISGNVALAPDALTLATPVISGVKAVAASARLGTVSSVPLFSGPVTLSLNTTSRSTLDARSDWTTPAFTAAQFLFPPASIRLAHWRLSGAPSHLSLAGSLDSTVQRFATCTLHNRMEVKLPETTVTQELRFPLHVAAAGRDATIEFADGDQSGVLTARLKGLYLEGVLVLPLGNLEQTRAEIPAQGFRTELEALLATQPFLAGTKPLFASADVVAHNSSPLKLGLQSAGLLDITVSVLTLANPLLRIGEGGSAARASLSLSAKGGATLASDLATGRLRLVRAHLEAERASLRLLEAGKWIDLGGVHVFDPVVSFNSFSLEVDQRANPPVATAVLSAPPDAGPALSISASQVARAADAAHPSDLVFSGSLSGPLTVAKLTARVAIAENVSLDEATLTNLALHVVGGDLRFGDGPHVAGAAIDLDIAGLAVHQPGGTLQTSLDNAHLRAAGTIDPGTVLGINNPPAFSIDLTVSGLTDRLSGRGSARLEGFSGNARSHLDTGFECDSGSHLQPEIEFNFATGPSALTAQLNDGHLTAEGTLGLTGIVMHTTGYSGCNKKSEHWVISPQHEAWTNGLCFDKFPPYECRWSVTIPEVSFNWHWRAESRFAAFTLGFTAPVLRLDSGRFDLCNRGLFAVPAGVTLITLKPEIETPYPGADALVNGLLGAALAPAESLAVTSLANGTGWTVSVVGTAAGNLHCIR